LKIIKAAVRRTPNGGASDIEVKFEIPVNPSDVDSANRLLASHDIKSKDYVVFVPGSAHSDKCWPVERFAALADRIAAQFSLPIVAVGTESDKIVVEEIRQLTDVPIANFTGRTSLSELVALLKSAKLVVSNDTGPGHIAAALGTPLVLMFSWSNPARIAPYGRSGCMIARDPYSRGPKIKSTDPEHNVKTITVDEVFQKVCEQLRA